MLPAPVKGKTVISAQVPQAECQRYATDLRSITQGRGIFSMKFAHYEDVPGHLVDALMQEHKEKETAHAH
jgi:elongation factor G